MKKLLNENDIKSVEQQIKEFETQTGSDLLLIIIDECDPYPAASWRFAFISSFITALVFSYYIEFHNPLLWPLFFFILMVITLFIGKFPWAKRLCLVPWEVRRETEEKAIELFHSLGTSKVSHQVTAMILISLLERDIEVLIDAKLKEKISSDDLEIVVQKMRDEFKEGHFREGLTDSIKILQDKITLRFNGKACQESNSELHDSIIFIHD